MMRGAWMIAAVLLMTGSAADARRKPVPPPPPLPTGTLIENVNGYTLDKTGGLVRFNGLLIDDNGRVRQILKAGDKREAVKFRTDGRGLTMLPGFIDLGGHVMASGRLPPQPEKERFRNNPVELEAVLTRAQERLAAAGITTVGDMGAGLDDWLLYRRFGDEGRLNVRIQAIADGLTVLEKVAPLKAAPWLYGDRLTMRGAMIAVQAKPAGASAAAAEDARIRNLVSKASMIGAQTVLKAAGDTESSQSLDVYAEMLPTYGKDRRYRIAYGRTPPPADGKRLAAMGILVSMPPEGASADLLAEGVRTTIDVGLMGDDPSAMFRALQTAITRPRGFNIQQAFAAVTLGAAYAGLADDRLGTLEPGKWADFILVDRDIFTVPAAALPQIQVMETWVGGRRVFVKKP